MNDQRYILPKHSRLYRVHNEERASNCFNSTTLGAGRFNPIYSLKTRELIGVLYLASYYVDAISETLMRQNQLGIAQFNTTDIVKKKLAQLDTVRELVFIDLNAIDALSDKLNKDSSYYPQLRQFSEYVLNHPDFDDIDGFVWDGIQRGAEGQRVFVVFEKNSTASDFVERVSEYLLQPTGLHKVKDAARALNCNIPESILN
ncbi:RES domain-containing protein (plasmid) [Aliivibrio salmonicida]|uniref:RES family NAD+ phosphorylase n=1 Tax=Aliivibrio salmonicida TaxID=40269 RepID=UPI000F6F77D9|nr:RES family NAD+ phosphorylase [Aliivibrio salmonicida]AZL83330.1 RES domain-containing protein [Aliivibrio salmonicida]